MERAALAGGLVGQSCSDCRRAGQCSLHRLLGGGGGGGTGRSIEQRLLADWSVERAELAAELVREAFSACMRTG